MARQYSVTFSAAPITAAQDLFEVTAAAAGIVRLVGLGARVAVVANAIDAQKTMTSHRTIELQVERAVHRAHASLAEQGVEPITPAEDRALRGIRHSRPSLMVCASGNGAEASSNAKPAHT